MHLCLKPARRIHCCRNQLTLQTNFANATNFNRKARCLPPSREADSLPATLLRTGFMARLLP